MKLPDRYKPNGLSASGGMGDIIFCTDNNLDRPVVVKKLQAGEERRRIVDEQKALMALRSKNVVQILDIISIIEGRRTELGLVLEFIAGDDLDIATLDPDLAYLKVLLQIATGLRDIHEAGVIHRDIKPNNIRIDVEGVVKIYDFGLARLGSAAAKTRGAVGTPVFMAPELCSHKEVSFSKAVDVYAFGVTALALLKSEIPRELRFDPPKPLSSDALEKLTQKAGHSLALLGQLSMDVVRVLQQCVSYRPEKRPKMDDVLGVLTKHVLKDRHRALVIAGGKPYEINSSQRALKVHLNSSLGIEIFYDGLDFIVHAVNGSVTINNFATGVGDKLPSSCVIGFEAGKSRIFTTFDISHPEVWA